MDPNALWLLALSIATPVAGVVGFAVQLRQVRKTQLENEKLLLEIAALKVAAESRDQRIQRVTTEEVLRFGSNDVMFSRGPNPGPDYPKARSSLLGNIVGALICNAGAAFRGLRHLRHLPSDSLASECALTFYMDPIPCTAKTFFAKLIQPLRQSCTFPPRLSL